MRYPAPAAVLLAGLASAAVAAEPCDAGAALEAARQSIGAGAHDQALVALQATLVARRAAGCPEGEGTAQLLLELAVAEQRSARWSEAQAHLAVVASLGADVDGRAWPGVLARALVLQGIGERENGAYQAAERSFAQALATPGVERERALLATLRSERAALASYQGDYRAAVEGFQGAVAELEAIHGTQHRDVAQALNNLGTVYQELGDAQAARRALLRALELKEALLGPRHPSLASTLSNLAVAQAATGEQAGAEALHARAAAVAEAGFGARHPRLAHVLEAWGEFRLDAGDAAGAAPLLERARAIREAHFGPHSSWTGETLVALARLRATQGDGARSRDVALRAVGIAAASGEEELEAAAFVALARGLALQGELAPAVFFAKLAINRHQASREGLAGLERPVQRSFLARREQAYRDAVDWLVALGRLAEAEQVFEMLREEAYFDFARPGLRAGDGGTTRASSSPAEQAVARRYQPALEALRGAGRAAQASSRSPPERLTAARRAHQAAAAEAISALVATAPRVRPQDPGDPDRLPTGVARLLYLVGPTRLTVVASTRGARAAVEVPITSAELHRRIFELRQAMQRPEGDARPASRALHQVLLAPVEALALGPEVERLELVLDGALRLVPFAALHDGQRFLVELVTPVVRTLDTGPRRADAGPPRLAAFGVSQAWPGVPALPQVARELERLVRRDATDADGVLPGAVWLDDAFTAEHLERALAEGYPLVHVASHFRFTPGAPEASFLLLGDGSHLTLEAIQRGLLSFAGVELLTLSACSTALEAGPSGSGLESLATLAGRRGAREVAASLWPVDDAATGVLMARLYTGWAAGSPDAAEALARAQRSFAADLRGPFAHPFYWAGFEVLTGRPVMAGPSPSPAPRSPAPPPGTGPAPRRGG